jgi:HSP20 family molecular chaperone IbpA
MPKEKKSFFERLTGTVKIDSDMEDNLDEPKAKSIQSIHGKSHDFIEEEDEAKEGQLTVDVHQTSDEIIIKTMVAGVRPEDLDISISRDNVVIKGKREEERGIKDDDYFIRELYWGSFSRTIVLPQEIEVEESEAIEKHGLLIIKLPKIDKSRQTKLRVKTL